MAASCPDPQPRTSPTWHIRVEAITGAIGSIGPRGGPPIPLLQVLGDFAGGGLHFAFGVLAAVFEAQRSGLAHAG
jgi:alpha-methylacyl-CoA racemase